MEFSHYFETTTESSLEQVAEIALLSAMNTKLFTGVQVHTGIEKRVFGDKKQQIVRNIPTIYISLTSEKEVLKCRIEVAWSIVGVYLYIPLELRASHGRALANELKRKLVAISVSKKEEVSVV